VVKLQEGRSRLRVPDSGGLISGSGDNALAVGAEGDRIHISIMTFQLGKEGVVSQMRALLSSEAVTTRALVN
jgi:hypothetical protein